MPSLMSTTRTAMSASEPPLARSVVNDWCPGVSMNSSPGTSNFLLPMSGPQTSVDVLQRHLGRADVLRDQARLAFETVVPLM